MRKALSIVLALIAVLFLVMTLTVPMIAAAGPAVIMLLFALMAYVAWPKNRVQS